MSSNLSPLRDDHSLHVASYEAPSVEYAAVASKKPASRKRKASSPDSGDDDSEAGQGTQVGRVQVCIKAKPWDLTLASESLDFRQAVLSAQLLERDSLAPVETRSVEPMSFSVRPNKSQGGKRSTCQVEVRIFPLSSQHEGALFCIRFTAESNGAKAECLTDPIRVVSKKTQLEKGAPKRSRTSQVATRDAVLTLIDKIEDQDTPAVLERIAAQNEQILSLLGGKSSQVSSDKQKKKKQKEVRSLVVDEDDEEEEEEEEEEDSSVSLQATSGNALQAFLGSYVDRNALVTDYNSLSDMEKQMFADLTATVLPLHHMNAAACMSPPPPPPAFPDYRLKSLENFDTDLFNF